MPDCVVEYVLEVHLADLGRLERPMEEGGVDLDGFNSFCGHPFRAIRPMEVENSKHVGAAGGDGSPVGDLEARREEGILVRAHGGDGEREREV